MSISVSVMSLHREHICLGIHRGALDRTLVTTEPPPRVMKRIRPVLDDMGVLVQVESEFRLRCIRRQQRRPDPVAVDAVDEVRFSVELTRLDGLHDTFSLDVRRLKGNLRSYKLLYDTLRQRAANLL